MFAWKSKALSQKKFRVLVTSGNSLAQKLTFLYSERIEAKRKVNCLMQDKIYFDSKFVYFS